MESYFYDTHCHIMDLTQPNFFVYLNELKDKFGNEAVKFLLSPDYLIDTNNKHVIEKLANLLNVMSHNISEILKIVEDDLNGTFLKSKKEEPVIQNEQIKIRDFKFDKYCMTPLVMDFNVAYNNYQNLYYNVKNDKDAEYYAEAFYMNLNNFYEKNPDSKLEIYPFFGINTPAYDIKTIEKFFKKYLKRYSPQKRVSYEASKSSLFAGIKFYPPLGLDPCPDDIKERDKVELIYQFATENKIPITTHCDDGGYRILEPDIAWKYTSPDRYIEVLKRYPDLKLNFAHLGQQYYRSYGIFKQNEWRTKIFKLMLEYPNIYSDFSFSIISKNYFETIISEIEEFKEEDQKVILDRLMFGSDFNINLNKINSYTEYLRIFEKSILTDEHILKFGQINPERFLFENI